MTNHSNEIRTAIKNIERILYKPVEVPFGPGATGYYNQMQEMIKQLFASRNTGFELNRYTTEEFTTFQYIIAYFIDEFFTITESTDTNVTKLNKMKRYREELLLNFYNISLTFFDPGQRQNNHFQDVIMANGHIDQMIRAFELKGWK